MCRAACLRKMPRIRPQPFEAHVKLFAKPLRRLRGALRWLGRHFLQGSMFLLPVRLLLAAQLMLFVTPASADDAAGVARDWGLIGTWAIDCTKPPKKGQGNTISYEVTSSGGLIYRRDFDVSDNNEVTEARIEPDHTLILSIVMPQFNQTRENGIAMQSDGSIHSIFSRGEDGSYTIRDGRFVANRKPTPALQKCRP
jgi:hypothetical protein